jgi:Uma2 family endonuclease
MVSQEKLHTAADLWELSHQAEYADKRLELVEGAIVEMSPTGGVHGVITSKLDRLIGAFVEANRLGITTGAESGYILQTDPHTVRAPDVGFVAADRLPDGPPEGYIPLAPDLAVEVVSPSDSASEIHERVQDFLRAGTRQVWVIYPRSRTAEVHTAKAAQALDETAMLDGSDVLPGFRVALADVFSALG